MDTIQSIFGLSPVTKPQIRLGDLVSTTQIGVEVEVENVIDPPSIPGWRCIPDGSLRNHGVEYVFRGPIGGMSACTRLTQLEAKLGAVTNKDFSVRTSVHVHMDAREMSWKQVSDLVILYAMVEPYLFSICGKERADSIYALSLFRGQQQVSKLCDIIRLGPARIAQYWTKYSAINLLSLTRFGSIEFRGHSGTCNKDKLVNWINHLLYLKKYVMDSDNSLDTLPSLMSCNGSVALLSAIFGERLVSANISHAHEASETLYESMWVAEDILHHNTMITNQLEIIQQNQGQTQLEKVKEKLCAV